MNNTTHKQTQQETEISVPTDLRKAISASPSVEAIWQDLTPLARWDFIHWVNTAKLAQTRQRRIERTCEMLPTGKRRPCCYSIVPMDLYKALETSPKAKEQWKILTPIERRNYISFLDAAKHKDDFRFRIEKMCEMLTAGKLHPSQ